MVWEAIQGLAACAFSSIFFGSMYVPLKRFSLGDGIFVQWVIGVAIWMVGIVVNAIRGFPPFQPLAMLGGVFWTIGNSTAVPIISTIGLGMGVLLWGVTNCIFGWASSRFGLFGLKQELPGSIELNYIGVGLVIIGGILFSRVRSEPAPARSQCPEFDDLTGTNSQDCNTEDVSPNLMSDSRRRIVSIFLSLFAGMNYGITFVPAIYIQQNYSMASQNGLDYVFSHFCGILITTTLVLLIYTVFKRNDPYINPQTVIPAYFSGTIWGLAQLSWFFANDLISQSITFPINSMVPGVCAAMWSVFYFHEIQGKRNMQILSVATVITLLGAMSVGLSKVL